MRRDASSEVRREDQPRETPSASSSTLSRERQTERRGAREAEKRKGEKEAEAERRKEGAESIHVAD